MGSSSSSISELPNNDCLLRFTGEKEIDSMDPFWNQFLSFTILVPSNSADMKLLEDTTLQLSKNLAKNNILTRNFRSLITNFTARCTELKQSSLCENQVFMQQTYNSVLIIRHVCKFFVENLSEDAIIEQLEDKNNTDNSGVKTDTDSASQTHLLDNLLTSFFDLLIDIPISDSSYLLHLEVINALLVLLSIQMYQPHPASSFMIYKLIMQGRCSISACPMVKLLLTHFLEQRTCPSTFYHTNEGHSGFSSSLASGLFTVLTLGLARTKIKQTTATAILANQSLLLLLVLSNHCTGERGLTNPYRLALFSFTNSQDLSVKTSPVDGIKSFHIDYNKLYTTLYTVLHDDQTTLLLYLLLHQHDDMKAYLLSRTTLDQLVVPLLRILYDAPGKSSHHIYMALIILLILTEDDYFNKAVHEITVHQPMWFKERHLADISLGGLLILTVVRTIQYNLTRMRDKYLHTNCLAALANMSATFSNLHPYVTQRLLSLFHNLSKRHQKVIEAISTSVPDSDDELSMSETHQENIQDLSVLEEVVRMVLEIINSCLCHALHNNINLVYSLLHQKELFSTFRTHPTFQDIIQNIDTVLSYFTSHLEQSGVQVSPADVYTVINQAARTFKRERLKKFPELKFKYVEEDAPEEFFVPYIWSLVCNSSHLYFNPQKIVLFSLPS